MSKNSRTEVPTDMRQLYKDRARESALQFVKIAVVAGFGVIAAFWWVATTPGHVPFDESAERTVFCAVVATVSCLLSWIVDVQRNYWRGRGVELKAFDSIYGILIGVVFVTLVSSVVFSALFVAALGK